MEDLIKKLTVTEVVEEVPGFKLLYLEQQGERFDYKAGQYLTFLFDGGDGEIRRSYSLVSSPALDEPLCIGVKRIDNGVVSRRLVDSVQAGDELFTIGAGGVFVFPQAIGSYKQVFFFAAGSGIVPIYSLIKTALHVHPHLQVVLVYSNSSVASTIFYRSLQALARQFGERLTIEWIFSDAKNLFRAHLHADLIGEIVRAKGGDNYTKALYYLCGPEAYMRMAGVAIRLLQVPADNIKREIFHTRKSVQRIEPPDNALHKVTLLRRDESYTVEVQHPMSILGAARKAGIMLPYSCEAGRCGNCIALCEKGKVWMSYNEVLTEKEVASGLILTCTGYPIDGDAVVRF